MDVKQLITVIIVASVSFTIVILLVLGIYKYKPEYMGLPPNPVDSTLVMVEDTVYIEPSVVLTQKAYNKLNKELAEKEYFIKEKDTLFKQKKSLLDSINFLKKQTQMYLDSIKRVENRYKDMTKKKITVEDSIKKLNQKFLTTANKAELTEKKLKDTENFLNKKIDTLEAKSFADFAKIYNNSNPTNVAKILEQIDDRDAAKILKLMSKKKAGKIIEAMDKEKAATILLLGY